MASAEARIEEPKRKKIIVSYHLYERYMRELSSEPYKDKMKYKDKFSNFFSNLFKPKEFAKVADWAMSDNEIEKIVVFMHGNRQLGFISLAPSILFDTWEFCMLPNLYNCWCIFLYGDEENIVPDYKNFCDLVFGQIFGTLERKSDIIFQICLKEGFDSRNRTLLKEDERPSSQATLNKYVVVKYFYDLAATFFNGLLHFGNKQYRGWENVGAGMKQNNLRVTMNYLTENLLTTVDCNASDIEFLLKKCPLILTILTGTVSMMFGREYPQLVPTFMNPRPTILDVSYALLLTDIIKNGAKDVTFKLELVYSQYLDEGDISDLHTHFLFLGPSFFLVQDESGYVFGGYASVSWMIGKFIGNEECFVFRLFPNVVVCRASGKNSNFMYLDSQEREAVRLGMGGDRGRHGLRINLTHNSGYCSDTCETWKDFTRLSNHSKFTYVHIEIWKVKKVREPISYEVTGHIYQREGEKPEHYSMGKLFEKEKSLLLVQENEYEDELRQKPSLPYTL